METRLDSARRAGQGWTANAIGSEPLFASLLDRPTPLAGLKTLGRRPPSRLQLWFAVFAASITAYLLENTIGSYLGGGAALLAFISCAGCGWSWLLTRALFDGRDKDARWPLALVLIIVGAHLVGWVAESLGADHPALRVIDNALGLASSTVLLLTAIEPFHTYRSGLPTIEKRFRIAFALGYVLLMGFAVLVLERVPSGPAYETGQAIRLVCAVLALTGGAAALWFRLRHPLASGKRRTAVTDDAALAERIAGLLETEKLYVTAQLKVGDLARKLGQPEYKVTQCITGAMGFANFNRLLNHYRIDHAKRMLADAACADVAILTIAMDSGFASLGPFNRAFKDATGMTPSAFRAAR